jgi:hypothetical protein
MTLCIKFPLIGREREGLSDIVIDVWLYGALKNYGGEAAHESFANLQVCLQDGCTMADLLAYLEIPAETRGITFINGQLSAMPGLQPDLGHVLQKGDRVGIFDPKSMWPFQYRHGAAMTEEMAHAVATGGDQGLHHSYEKKE